MKNKPIPIWRPKVLKCLIMGRFRKDDFMRELFLEEKKEDKKEKVVDIHAFQKNKKRTEDMD